jgi:hypothetical protein
MATLKPWARGPFELLRHAEGHLKAASDFDKRMAFISFDNAIEVSIGTFLQLNPIQRNGKQYKREDVATWQANYHAKLDFFYDQYLTDQSVVVKVDRDIVVWSHSLRNQFYHTGGGMAPGEEDLLEVRAAALWIFSLLYDVDAESALNSDVPSPTYTSKIAPEAAFLQTFIELERTLRDVTMPYRPGADAAHLTVARLWSIYKVNHNVAKADDMAVAFAMDVRNRLAHGRAVEAPDEDLKLLQSRIEKIIKSLA